MPSRRGIVLILLFWIVVTGFVGYRDVWPRLFADTAPTVWIDLSDEASQTVPVRWAVFRGANRIGTVTTNMTFDAPTDRFCFVTRYRDLTLDVGRIKLIAPDLDQTVTVGRDGKLRSQHLKGTITANIDGLPLGFQVSAAVDGEVIDGLLTGRCQLTSSSFPSIDEPLKPTPVPDGQVLNPLQPVNRLRGVTPGRRWLVHEINPLFDAVATAVPAIEKKLLGTSLGLWKPPADKPALLAVVADAPVLLETPVGSISCWLIEFQNGPAVGRVWVAVSDGRVLQQQADMQGESVRITRED